MNLAGRASVFVAPSYVRMTSPSVTNPPRSHLRPCRLTRMISVSMATNVRFRVKAFANSLE